MNPAMITDREFNRLLNGPLAHPFPMFKITRLALALRAVLDATGEPGVNALRQHCAAREAADGPPHLHHDDPADGGHYDAQLKAVLAECGSQEGVLMVLDGYAGDGFSVCMQPGNLANLPTFLRDVANKVQADPVTELARNAAAPNANQ